MKQLIDAMIGILSIEEIEMACSIYINDNYETTWFVLPKLIERKLSIYEEEY